MYRKLEGLLWSCHYVIQFKKKKNSPFTKKNIDFTIAQIGFDINTRKSLIGIVI